MATGGRETGLLFERRIDADAGALAELQRDVRAAMAAAGLAERAAYAVDFALEELGTNSIQHGYGPHQAGPLAVTVTLEATQVVVAIDDQAPAFDPRTAPDAESVTDLEAAPIGGRGLSMLRRLVASLEHSRVGEVNRNVVRIQRGENR